MRVLGREHELGVFTRLLEQLTSDDGRSACVVLEAPAGSGKTTLLDAIADLAAATATATEATVLRCAPTVAERDLPYAALGDLFDRVHLAQLDLAQLAPIAPVAHLAPVDSTDVVRSASGTSLSRWRAILERVLLRDQSDSSADPSGIGSDEPGGAGAPDAPGAPAELDARMVGTACAVTWAALSARAPVVVLVDDSQWLDAATAAALAFAVRRLPPRGVLVVVARRSRSSNDAGRSRPPDADIVGEPMPLPPLPGPVIAAIVTQWTRALDAEREAVAPDRAARAIDGRQLRSIVDAAAGNPLYAVELARNASSAVVAGRELLTVPPSIEELLAHRLSELSAEVMLALAAVALLGRPTPAVLRRLDLLDLLAVAERAGVIDTASGRAVFSHPLLAAVVLQRTGAIDRRALHRRLAACTDDPVDAALHAARAAEEPDEQLAHRLDELTDIVQRRGARDHAAELACLALDLTPPDHPSRPARAVTAAHLSFQCGDSALAAAQLAVADAGPVAPSREVAFRAALVRATIEFSLGTSAGAQHFALAALELCERDAERIEVYSLLARISYDDFDRAALLARTALSLAEGTDVSSAVMASALVARAGTELMTGEGLDRAAFDRAIELERDDLGYAPDSAYGSLAVLLKVTDELDEARTMLHAMLDGNDDGAEPYVRSHLPQLELWAGNWDAAEDHANRHLEAALRTGQQEQVVQAHANLASVGLHRGDLTAARSNADELRRTGAANREAWTERSGLGVLGAVAMAEGDAPRAVELFTAWHRLGERMGLREPGYCRFDADFVEALVGTGRLDDAQTHADLMAERAVRIGRRTAVATAQRVQALVSAARGEHDRAIACGRAAVDALADSVLVVEHARALLTLGQVHRRFKEKAAARDALTAALQVFERLGAEHFAERARQDLGRLGLRPAAGLGLTATEQRVAESAATGRTMRQVADELFMSPKTAEANLSRVYRKLGVGSRAELATWFADQRPRA